MPSKLKPSSVVLICMFFLVIIGAVAIYDFSPAHYAYAREAGGDRFHYLRLHFINAACGLAGMAAIIRWKLNDFAYYRFFAALALLALMTPLFPGVENVSMDGNCYRLAAGIRIHTGWWGVLLAIPILCKLIADSEKNPSDSKNIWMITACAVTVNFFLWEQDNLPMLVLFDGVILLLIVFSGQAIRDKAIICTLVSLTGGLGKFFSLLTKPYFIKAQLAVYCHRADSASWGYQAMLARRDILHGGFSGAGWGRYTSGRTVYTPDTMSRFILQSIGREYGLVGIAGVVVIYGALAWGLMRHVKRIEEPAHRKTAMGMSLFILLSVAMGFLRTLNLLPLMPSYQIPFIGYGFDGIVTSFLAMGFILSGETGSRCLDGGTDKEGAFNR